jgi:hypothetical protein
VDGTKYEIYVDNLVAEYHIRYGGYGAIAYHYVAANYIALFSRFFPCGVLRCAPPAGRRLRPASGLGGPGRVRDGPNASAEPWISQTHRQAPGVR